MSSTTAENPTDRRNARWAEHRAKRRYELVDATLRAIRSHGAGVGMDGIASLAGTSKTVFYRHFTDRAGLYGAVAERVNTIILQHINQAVGDLTATSFAARPGAAQTNADTRPHPRQLLSAAVDAYLALVEDDPEVYRFIVAAPLVPPAERTETIAMASTVSQDIARHIGELLARALAHGGQPTDPARTWGNAIVGMVQAAGDDWLREGAAASGVSRESLNEQLTQLIWGGLSAAVTKE